MRRVAPALYWFIAGAAFFFVLWAWSAIRLRQFRRKRGTQGLTREQFVEVFRAREIPTAVSAAVYDYYQPKIPWKEQLLLPADRFGEWLSDDQGDMEDDAEALLEQLGLRWPREAVLQEGFRPINALEDMVLWLAWIRQYQDASAPPNQPSLTYPPA